MRPWILLLFGIVVLGDRLLDAAERPSKPNVILIFIDDMGYADVGCFGAEKIRTPNIDRLAKEGIKFTDFYSNCAVCSGSRAALLTGCHYQRLSIAPVLFPRDRVGLNPEEVTIAEMLKASGYATACVGKWHLGHQPNLLPTRQGFDSYLGIPYSNDMWIDPQAPLAKDVKLHDGWTQEKIRSTSTPPRNVSPLYRNEEVIEYPIDQTQLTRLYTEESVKFIKANQDNPFFLYLPHNMCHVPLFASEAFKGKSEAGLFGDVIEELDWSVGEVLKTLKETGIDERTLVIFTSDNGAATGSAKPLRGKKATMYEGGVREPTLMRWPGQIPAGSVCSEVAGTIDILPTLAQLAGASLPERKIDGQDIWSLMRGDKQAKSPHEHYVLLHGAGSVRSGKWKYYPWPEGAGGGPNQKKKKAPAPTGHPVQLYDLSSDVGETKNVAADHPQVVQQLHAAYVALKEEIAASKRPIGQGE